MVCTCYDGIFLLDLYSIYLVEAFTMTLIQKLGINP